MWDTKGLRTMTKLLDWLMLLMFTFNAKDQPWLLHASMGCKRNSVGSIRTK